MGKKVFISYTRVDVERAGNLFAELKITLEHILDNLAKMSETGLYNEASFRLATIFISEAPHGAFPKSFRIAKLVE